MSTWDPDALRKWLKSLGAKWPNVHPYTGEEFIECSFEMECEAEVGRSLPPSHPSQEWEEVDCDCCGTTTTHRLTDKEYAKAIKRWKKAVKEFHRTNGAVVTQAAPPVLTGTFVTKSSSSVEAVWTGERWKWLGSSVAAPPGPGCRSGWFENPEDEATGL